MTHPQPGDVRVFAPPAPAEPHRQRRVSLVARSDGVNLAPWHRRVVLAAAIGLAATGLIWIAAEQGLGLFPELDGAAARSRMHALLVIHGVLAYAGAVLLGSLLGRHIPAGLRSGRRTATGITALSLAGALLLTALLLYYAGSDTVRSASSIAHQLLGVAAIAVVWIHLTRRERPREGSRPAGQVAGS